MSNAKTIGATIAISVGVALVWGNAANGQVALPPEVESATLAQDAFSTGLLTPAEGALPASLWQGARADTLEYLLSQMPARVSSPGLGNVLTRTLLSSGAGPDSAPASLGGAKLQVLANMGFSEDVRSLASLSNTPSSDPQISKALAVADLLDGDIDRACQRNAALSSSRNETFWVKLRVLCYHKTEAFDAADLTIDILQERNVLSDSEVPLFFALTSNAASGLEPVVTTPLHYAIATHLKLPINSSSVETAGAGVLKAMANNAQLPPRARLSALTQAASLGVHDAASVQAVFNSIAVDPDTLGNANSLLSEQPGDIYTDVVVNRTIQQMSAPEFLRDKASLIANSLAASETFDRAHTLSILYADEIMALEGALIGPSEAGQFGLSRLIIGDSAGAEKWLRAMLGGGSVAVMEERTATELIELINLLALLDPARADAVAQTAGVAVTAPFVAATDDHVAGADKNIAPIVDAAFSAVANDIQGQAVLVALAVNQAAASGNEIAQIVSDQALKASGFDQLRRRIALENALKRSRYLPAVSTVDPGLTETGLVDEVPSADRGFLPRIKPVRG